MVYNENYKIKALSMYNSNNTIITSESSAQVITPCDTLELRTIMLLTHTLNMIRNV